VAVLGPVWAAPCCIGEGVGPEASSANEAARKGGAVCATVNDASLGFLDNFRRGADRSEIAGDDSSWELLALLLELSRTIGVAVGEGYDTKESELPARGMWWRGERLPVLLPVMPMPLAVRELRMRLCSWILGRSDSRWEGGPPERASMAACLGMCR
jgi:hypothetical protein